MMASRGAANLHEDLIKLQEHGSLLIEDEIYVTDLSNSAVTDKLNEIVDSLQADPESMLNPHNLDAAKSFLKYMKELTDENRSKLIDILLSAFKNFMIRLTQDISSHNDFLFNTHKQTLEAYVLLWHCTVIEAEKLWKDRQGGKVPSFLAKRHRGGARSTIHPVTITNWVWSNSRIIAVRVANRLISSDIKPLYIHQSDLDIVLNLVLKTLFTITDDPKILEDNDLKELLVETLVLCSSLHGKSLDSAIESKIFHDYLREEALVDFVTSFAIKLCSSSGHKIIIDNILKRLAATSINCDDTPIVKAFSKFLLKMSVVLPKEVFKQMIHLQSLLYSGSYTIRYTIIEAMGNIIPSILDSSPQIEASSSLESYYDIFKERYRDISSNVRVKVLQTINKLAERRHENMSSSYIPLSLRPHFVEMTVGRLLDKSTNVRRNAVRLLARLIETSPFVLKRDMGSLSYELLSSRKKQLSQLIETKFSSISPETDTWCAKKEQSSTTAIYGMDVDCDENSNGHFGDSQDIISDPRCINRIRALMIYYTDAISFVKLIESTLDTMLQLVMSNYKGEAVEAMRFFIVCNRYGMEFAMIGIRKMIHKIWDKDIGESGRMSVRETLIRCYVSLYLQNDGIDLDPSSSADNLVNCTLDMSLSELTSFEQLLYSIHDTHISKSIIYSLWKIFTAPIEPHPRRLGAIIVLGSFAKADSAIITHNIKYILEFLSCKDSSIDLLLSRYVCSAIAQLKNASLKDSNTIKEHVLTEKLISLITNLILEPSSSEDWLGYAEQAISAIYIISKLPSKVCSGIIRTLASRCFSENLLQNSNYSELSEPMDPTLENIDVCNQNITKIARLDISKLDLCKLFFVVGHVAVKQLVYLEDTEQDWKQIRQAEVSRLQSAARSAESKPINEELDSLMKTEEDITSYMQYIKEKELLYGKNSLLGLFGHIISYVCANSETFNDPILQNISIISLSKIMCISPVFCESNLPLLLSILETSHHPIIRNNIIVGLGDLTICFNSILDKHMTQIYDRLGDPDPSVRKSTLMLLSFLILNGMIRIRGQISTIIKCLSDPDRSVKSVARLFFSEFSSKDNSIYNNLVDIISNLSSTSSGVSEQDFQSIFKIILESVKKEKFTENLIEKLCHRLKCSELPCQCRNLSFCLSYLVHNSDRCMKKFMDCLPYYSSKLSDPTILALFIEVCVKYKKSTSQDFRQTVENFENVLRNLSKNYIGNSNAETAALDVVQDDVEQMDIVATE